MYKQTQLNGFWDDLLQTTERVATQVINRPQTTTVPTVPAPRYPLYPGGTAISPVPASTLLTLGAIGLGLYLLTRPRGRR